MKRIYYTLCLAGGVVAMMQPAQAQRPADPNLGHFYMARQQIQITDDAPLVNDQRTNPAAQQSGALPQRPVALPRAGWQPYSSSMPSFSNSLPQVVNGVPPKAPPPVAGPSIKSNKAKAGNYAWKSSQKAPASVKAYTPYKGYGGNAPVSAVGSGSSSTSTNVQGSLLHWSRTKRGSY